MYSVEQVAERLGLHVRTVRGYIRSGRLRAVRIGKQYRIAHADLAALTGQSAPAAGGSPAAVEVSSIVQIGGVGPTAADRLGTFIHAAANTGAGAGQPPPRVQTIYEEERNRMRIVILGGPAASAELLRMIDSVVDAILDRGDGLPGGEVGGA